MLLEQLQQIKQQIHDNKIRVDGIVKAHKKGFGFLESKKDKKTYFITPLNMKKLMHGDKIRACISEVNGKEQAEPEELLEPFLKTEFVSKVYLSKNKNNKTIVQLGIDHHNIDILFSARFNTKLDCALKQGDYVLARLVAHPLKEGTSFIANIEKFICNGEDNYLPWFITFIKNKFDYQTNIDETIPSIDEYKDCQIQDSYTRQDLTDLNFFTIDSINSKDLDDAVCIKPLFSETTKIGWKLYIAIADPSAFILPNSELDMICQSKLTTSYFYNFNFPMLPRFFSENTCSLLPQQQKSTLVCEVDIDLDGNILNDALFYLAWINSKEKLDYDGVANFVKAKLNLNDCDQSIIIDEKYHELDANIQQQLIELYYFTLARVKWRNDNTLPTQNEYEFSYILDKGKLVDIQHKKIKISHRMIEECMVLANLSGAKFLAKHNASAIYSTNAGFRNSSIKMAEKFIHEHNIKEVSDLSSLDEYKSLWNEIKILEHKDKTYFEMRLKKYLSATEYKSNADIHFGLAVNEYITWTSPIRRYSDMINHRIIKSIIYDKQTPTDIISDKLLNDISENKRKNRNIELEINNWLYCDYIRDNIILNQDILDAVIVDLNNVIIKAELKNNGIIVLIPTKNICHNTNSIKTDFENAILLIDDQPKYRLADDIKIQITSLNEYTKQIFAKII